MNWLRTRLQQFLFKNVTIDNGWLDEEEETASPDTVSLPDPLTFKVQLLKSNLGTKRMTSTLPRCMSLPKVAILQMKLVKWL